MADEKRHDPAKESPKVIEEAGQPHYDIALGEAADIYGDIQTAQGECFFFVFLQTPKNNTNVWL